MRSRLAIVAVFVAVLALAPATHASTDPPAIGGQSMNAPSTMARVAVVDTGGANYTGALVVKLSATVAEEYIVNTKNHLARAAPSVSLLVGQGESGVISRGSGLLQLESNKVDTLGFARGSPRANDTTFVHFDSGGGSTLTNLVPGVKHYTEKIGGVDRNNGLV